MEQTVQIPALMTRFNETDCTRSCINVKEGSLNFLINDNVLWNGLYKILRTEDKESKKYE